MAEAYLTKHHCLQRAKDLLASGEEAALRYACLELRMCIEAVTYDKLSAYARRLPPELLSNWRPHQAIAGLLELEEQAGDEYTLAMGTQGSPPEMLGEHRTFRARWLKDNHNKLGNFLHTPNRNSAAGVRPRAPETLRAYLEGVAQECERVVQSSVTAIIANVVEFNCQLCGRKVTANAKSTRAKGRATCLYPDCGAEHVVTQRGEDLYFTLSGLDVPCIRCKEGLLVPGKLAAEGHVFACTRCGLKHRLVDQVWRYQAEADEGSSSETM